MSRKTRTSRTPKTIYERTLPNGHKQYHVDDPLPPNAEGWITLYGHYYYSVNDNNVKTGNGGFWPDTTTLETIAGPYRIRVNLTTGDVAYDPMNGVDPDLEATLPSYFNSAAWESYI